MSTLTAPFAGTAPRLSPARIVAVVATSVLVLFGVLLGGRAFIAASGGADDAGPLVSVSRTEPVMTTAAANTTVTEQREAVTRSRGI